MKKARRLESLLKIAQLRERKLAGCVKKSMARCSAHEAQLGHLNAYRTQYRTAFLPGQGEISAGQLKNLWQFIEKLDAAIAQGRRRAAQAREEYWRDQRSFMTARARTKVLEELRSRCQLDEKTAEVRRENKEHDEYAQRMVTNGRC